MQWPIIILSKAILSVDNKELEITLKKDSCELDSFRANAGSVHSIKIFVQSVGASKVFFLYFMKFKEAKSVFNRPFSTKNIYSKWTSKFSMVLTLTVLGFQRKRLRDGSF